MFNFENPIPLSLYIHIPWCIRKCPYCDFNSHVSNEIPEQSYVQALIDDLDQDLAKVWGRPLQSIFIGGGTPSLFSADSLDKLLTAIKMRFTCHPEIETTLEANPGTAEAERFAAYKSIGINRLSLGIQSFNDEHLTKLGRIHDSEQALAAIAMAKAAGYSNFNLDLMHGLPQQTPAQAQQDLSIALAQAPLHLSWYQLTLEPNTVFYKHPPLLPGDDALWTIQEQGQAHINRHGLTQYEVSAYCSTGNHCRHNVNYWQFGDYIGIGAGAHGKLTDVANGRIERTQKYKQPQSYLTHANKTAQTRVLSAADARFEFMLNALRLNEAVTFELFEQRTGLQRSVLDAAMSKLAERDLLDYNQTGISPTPLGQRFLNDLIAAFM